MKIFFSAGEPSGDRHAAEVIRRLRAIDPGLECSGFGGPHMAAAGCRLLHDMSTLAVMWVLQVVLNLRTFFRLAAEARKRFKADPPDAVVLVDYPGFNWWIASYAKECGIPVYYYCPPQLWAWGGGRIKKMRKYVDHVFCTLPFEYDFYRRQGMACSLVGHPFFEDALEHAPDEALRAELKSAPGPLVLLLPGSRRQEVHHNLPTLLKAAEHIKAHVPDVRFVLGAQRPALADLAANLCAESTVKVRILTGCAPDLMATADAALAVSGSVSLELLHHKVPTVVNYNVGRFGYWLQNRFRRVKYITLVNLLAAPELHPRDLSLFEPTMPGADAVPFPEYLTCRDRSRDLAEHVIAWLVEPHVKNAKLKQLEELRSRYARPGASERTAAGIARLLGAEPSPAGTASPVVPAPHRSSVAVSQTYDSFHVTE